LNILYLSCHAILEENELSIFHELGHEVFSLGGAYQNPENPGDPKRPPIAGMKFNQHLADVAIQCSKDDIHPELLDWADVIITMHNLEWFEHNWAKIREHKVIPVWRSIGQSIDMWEQKATFLRAEGLKIVRYSPFEERVPQYAGSDAVIRFGVDPKEFRGWVGGNNHVHVYGQAIKSRGKFLHYDLVEEVTSGFGREMYGPSNEDCEWSKGVLSYDQLKNSYQHADVAFYTGTIPASYTLSFIEMGMTGTPIVAIGKKLCGVEHVFPGQDTYEIPDIIRNRLSGFVSDDINELRANIQDLLQSQELRQVVSQGIRNKCVELFSRNKTVEDWKTFLGGLPCKQR
jgi:glycosyltransferase involved in cell wall biosynthesis